MVKISALVVVHNEENQIKSCLESLVFADELVVILDNCNDGSKDIIKKFTKKYYVGDWPIEGDRRNFGISKCSNDWILEIDADERVSNELKDEILNVINESKYDWHQIEVNNFIKKKLIRYGWGSYFGKSAYAGLFRKGVKVWGRQRVHPKIELSGKRGKNLKNRLTHYYCSDISDLLKKLDSYSNARALDLKHENSNESLLKNIRRIFSRFWKCFFLRKGFREGKFGFLIAIVACLYPLISYLKFKEKMK